MLSAPGRYEEEPTPFCDLIRSLHGRAWPSICRGASRETSAGQSRKLGETVQAWRQVQAKTGWSSTSSRRVGLLPMPFYQTNPPSSSVGRSWRADMGRNGGAFAQRNRRGSACLRLIGPGQELPLPTSAGAAGPGNLALPLSVCQWARGDGKPWCIPWILCRSGRQQGGETFSAGAARSFAVSRGPAYSDDLEVALAGNP